MFAPWAKKVHVYGIYTFLSYLHKKYNNNVISLWGDYTTLSEFPYLDLQSRCFVSAEFWKAKHGYCDMSGQFFPVVKSYNRESMGHGFEPNAI